MLKLMCLLCVVGVLLSFVCVECVVLFVVGALLHFVYVELLIVVCCWCVVVFCLC